MFCLVQNYPRLLFNYFGNETINFKKDIRFPNHFKVSGEQYRGFVCDNLAKWRYIIVQELAPTL